MTGAPDDRQPVRVQTDDGTELEATRGPAVGTVLDEGGRVEQTWTAEDFKDADWEHPDTRPRMRGWLHLFAFFGAIVAGAVLIPLGAVLGARSGFSVAVHCLTICGPFGSSARSPRPRRRPRPAGRRARRPLRLLRRRLLPRHPRAVRHQRAVPPPALVTPRLE